MRINEDFFDNIDGSEIIQNEEEMISDNTPCDQWYEKCKSDGYKVIVAPSLRFVYGVKKETIEKLVKKIRHILETVFVDISTTQISAVNQGRAEEYENIGVVVENPAVFQNRYLGEFVIKTAVKTRTNNLELILRMFAQLSALMVGMSNMAIIRFAVLKDGQWKSEYVLPGYDKPVRISLEVPVDIQNVIYGTK
jgi:hypothetical protein